jgi:hypothetical protein
VGRSRGEVNGNPVLPRLIFYQGVLVESMVRSIASPVDGARVPSTEVQAPQPWVVIRPSVIQSRKGMRTSISLGDFRVATAVTYFAHGL